MEEGFDPAARQMALTALTTEQFNLQTARMGTISEGNGRSSLYLGTLSSATIAIAFIGQTNDIGDVFYLFALTLLPPVFLLGIFTYLRLVQTGIEDYVYSLGAHRIREYVTKLDPSVAPFFLPTDTEGMRKLQRMGMVPRSRFQAFLTMASMVACINAIVGGVVVALAVRSIADAEVVVAAVSGGVAALVFAGTFMRHGVRSFLRAAEVAPELFAWESSGAVGWSEEIRGKGR
jgi:hypothetical protein